MTPESSVLRLEHIGIAVADTESVISALSALTGRRVYKTEDVASEAVRTHFIEAGSVKIELLESLDPASALGRYLEKRGPGLHHLAFETSDLDEAWTRLTAAGFEALSAPKDGADGKRIFFFHPRSTAGLLIELCATRDDLATPPPGTGPEGSPRVRITGTGPSVHALSSALSRRLIVTDRDADVIVCVGNGGFSEWAEYDSSVQTVVLLDPGPSDLRAAAALDGVRPVLVIDRSSGDGDPSHGEAHDGPIRTVRVPGDLLDRMPDPWTTLSDLVVAFVRSRS